MGGNDHGVNASGASVNIFNGDLGFSVRAEEIYSSLLADLSELVREAMSELDRHGHQLGRFVASKAEHQALVAGAAGVHAHGDVGRLLLDGANYAAGLRVEAKLGAGVAYVANHFAGEIGEINIRSGGDFTSYDHKSGGDESLASNAAHGIVR